MVLKFKILHGKPVSQTDEPVILIIKNTHAQIVTKGRQRFVQIKCDTPGEFKNFKEFLKQYIGDVVSTNRYIYIPCEWIYTDEETLYGEDDDDSLFEKLKSCWLKRVNEDYIEDISDEEIIDDVAPIENKIIDPTKWDYCFSFQLPNYTFNRLLPTIKSQLENLFLHYTQDYRVDDFLWKDAIAFNTNEFEGRSAVDLNGVTLKSTPVVFVQFTPKVTVKTWFVVSLISILYNNLGKDFYSIQLAILRFFGSNGKQYVNVRDNSWWFNHSISGELNRHYALRLGEALKEFENFIEGSRKGFKELCGAIAYIRLCMGQEYSDDIVDKTTADMKEIFDKIK